LFTENYPAQSMLYNNSMNEHGPNIPDDPLKQSFPDVTELTGEDEDDYAAWAEWAAREPEAAPEPYPHELRLDETAQERKSELNTRMTALLDRLDSKDVQARGHYALGGESEVVTQMRQLQLEELPRIYADVRYESDYLLRHTRQATPDWCQLACIENAFRALGDETVTQDVIADAAGVHPGGPPFPEEMMDFARSRGLAVQTTDSVASMIDRLAHGSKIVLLTGYPVTPMQHAILVSGVRIDQGNIEFLYNNPSEDDGAKSVGLERMLQLLEPPLAHNKISRSYSLSRTQ
jgi:hypothetical protein